MSLFFIWRCRLTPKKPSWVFLPACLPACLMDCLPACLMDCLPACLMDCLPSISIFPRSAHLWGPTSEDCFQGGMGWLKDHSFWVTSDNARGPMGRCWVVIRGQWECV